jgi:uncharacterized protein (TIGR02611 family)
MVSLRNLPSFSSVSEGRPNTLLAPAAVSPAVGAGYGCCGDFCMLRWVRLQWRDLKCGRPGMRFRQRWRGREQRRRSYFSKPLYITAGLFVFLVGLVMLPAPGPGCLVVFVGASMMAEESFWVATVLDRIELKARRALAWAVKSWKRAVP